MDLEGSYFMSL